MAMNSHVTTMAATAATAAAGLGARDRPGTQVRRFILFLFYSTVLFYFIFAANIVFV